MKEIVKNIGISILKKALPYIVGIAVGSATAQFGWDPIFVRQVIVSVAEAVK